MELDCCCYEHTGFREEHQTEENEDFARSLENREGPNGENRVC